MSRGRKIMDDEIMACFEQASEPLTAGDIHEMLCEESDVSQRAVTGRLNDLAEEGKIIRKEAGARAIVWYREGDFQPATSTS